MGNDATLYSNELDARDGYVKKGTVGYQNLVRLM